MRHFIKLICCLAILTTTACVSTKQYDSMQSQLQQQITAADDKLADCQQTFSTYQSTSSKENADLERQLRVSQQEGLLKDQQLRSLRDQIDDLKQQRDRQLAQMGDLTVLSKSANENIRNTLTQLEAKDKYIQSLHMAKSKADSANLALAVNLKEVLQEGIKDKDVEVRVDKTLVFINLSDKMLYQSATAKLTPKAQEVLGKIAQVLQSRSELEILVEGYTDNVPVKNSCVEDNWDLSAKRATAVVRTLQQRFGFNPDKLIAAGRGEYNVLASNTTAEGRAMNRRTRIMIMPKLHQFYDLLNPNTMPK